jgi:hypothetical protein
VRASPARGYAALLVLLVAAAAPVLAETPRVARDQNAQPAVESAGLGLDLRIAALQARMKKLESGEPRDDATAEDLAGSASAVVGLQQAADWSRRIHALARLRREGEDLPQNTRTETETMTEAES